MVLKLLTITAEETRLFSLLLNTIEHFQLSGTVLRVSGGWVRDKLLGRSSVDIDISINNRTGSSFAKYVNEYLKFQKIPTHSIGVIIANPEQSKHLETAKVKILSHEVDFVNLRSESYAIDENHRIPSKVEFGSPEQDANRRDFTVNALFYNINSAEVEDFTLRGIQDLEKRVIRTPLSPILTFLDDPLRVLRAIRFATKLDFEIMPEVLAAAQAKETKTALETKVSRERISVETVKMLSANPLKALNLLRCCRVLDVVFRVPNSYATNGVNPSTKQIIWRFNGYRKDTSWIQQSIVLIEQLSALLKILPQPELQIMDKLVAWFSAILYPLNGQQTLNHRGKEEPTVVIVLRDSLKQKNILTNEVNTICEVASIFIFLLDEAKPNQDFIVTLASAIRKAKQNWYFSLLIALCVKNKGKDYSKVVESFQAFISRVESLGLSTFYSKRPLLNGKEIMEAVKLQEKGPIISTLIARMWDWNALHPQGAKDEVVKFLAQLDISSLK